MQTEQEFLNDLNALISQALEDQNTDLWGAMKTLADEVRERITELEAD